MAVKILVVDDEPDLELLITQRFRKRISDRDYEFIFTCSGIEALEKLQQQQDIEIILTDINMPEMDGLTLLSHLSLLDRPYKAIVISAYEDISNIRSAMNRGAVDFLTKPMDFKDLEVTLAKIIEECRLLKESLAVKRRLLDIDKELEIARNIQQAMIPQKFELMEGNRHFELLGVVLPARQIGGDFFDFFALDDSHIGLIIADVSGKSIPASLFMAITKTLFRSIASQCATTDQALREVSTLLSMENPSCMFVTAFYAIIDIRNGILTYSNAGHTRPYVVSHDQSIIQIGGEDSRIPLGLDDSLLLHPIAPFEQRSLRLKDKDCLVLYTDGVTEAMNDSGQLYKEQRLEKVLQQSGQKDLKELIDFVLADIRSYSGEVEQSDDIALLCLRYFATRNHSTLLKTQSLQLETAAAGRID